MPRLRLLPRMQPEVPIPGRRLQLESGEAHLEGAALLHSLPLDLSAPRSSSWMRLPAQPLDLCCSECTEPEYVPHSATGASIEAEEEQRPHPGPAVSPSLQLAHASSDQPFTQIPVVDFGEFLHGSTSQQREVAAQIGDACRNVGFMYLVNHGVWLPVELCSRVLVGGFCGSPNVANWPRAALVVDGLRLGSTEDRADGQPRHTFNFVFSHGRCRRPW